MKQHAAEHRDPPADGRLDRLQRLGRFVQLDPDNNALLTDYAFEAVQAEECDAAVQAVDKLAQRGAAEPEAHAAVAALLRKSGRIPESVDHLRRAIERWPDHGLLAVELARGQFALGEIDQALEALTPSPQDSALAAEVCGLRIRLLHHLGRLEEALATADAFRDPGTLHPEVDAPLLPVLIDLSRLDEAVQLASGLAALDVPMPYEVAEPLALAALDAQDTQTALDWTDRALQMRRDDGRIWLARGMANLRAGQAAPALEALDHAVRLMPGHAGSHLARGWAGLLNRDRERAREAFQAGIAASPSFGEGHGSLAVLDVLDGRFDEARAGIRKAQLLDANCASASFAALLLKQPAGHDIARLAERVLARARAGRPQPH